MRLKLILSGVMLSPALVLAGCGMNATSSFTSNIESPAVSGRTFGGQNPISGATIEVVAMGTTGYGSPGTVLASATTDAEGNFSFAPGAYSCPQADTPVYLLGVGGDSGSGNNPSIMTAAGLGTCTAGKSSYTVMNEVTTTALAFALAHFFSPTIGGSNGANDWFGGPSTVSNGTVQYSRGLVLGNSHTIPAMVSNAVGAPNQSTTTFAIDADKINAVANVLAACINSSGSTGPGDTTTPCGKLFFYTTPPGSSTAPSDTLQAAVEMALHPTQNVANIFNLITPQAPFTNTGVAPHDWTIALSYTTPSAALAVDSGTVSTVDIDQDGRVWFPSNGSGVTGATNFDPYAQAFNGPYNTTGLGHPEQVAVDGNHYVWLNDSVSSTLSSYLTYSPTQTQSLILANSISDSVTIGDDNRVNVGIDNGSVYGVANVSVDRTSYTLENGPDFPFPVTSMAGDAVGGDGVAVSDPIVSSTQDWYVFPNGSTQSVASIKALSGQVIFTGNDFVSVASRSGRSGTTNDGLCIFSRQACYAFQGPLKNSPAGIAIDGASNLWVAESGDSAVLNIPVTDASAGSAAAYLSASGDIPVNEYPHGPSFGDTMTRPEGIAIDAEGNVWVSNAGCNISGCTPGNFTLSEIVGAATPTITPVSGQITGTDNLVGTKPTF